MPVMAAITLVFLIKRHFHIVFAVLTSMRIASLLPSTINLALYCMPMKLRALSKLEIHRFNDSVDKTILSTESLKI